MEGLMAGTTVSFVADLKLAERVKEIARSDGITQSQAAARASALGALLPPAARKSFRLVLEEGGDEAQRLLAVAMTKAIAQVANTVLEKQLLARAKSLGLDSRETEEAVAARAVQAVADYRREISDETYEPGHGDRP
jgi:hypothetical protein